MNAIEPKRAPWRMLSVGSTVWAPFGEHGWRAATITNLRKNRAERTVVHLAFETGGQGRRQVDVLYWRKPELRGQDKPAKRVRGETR